MNDSFESRLEEYLEGLRYQRACNILGEKPQEGFYTKMDRIYDSFTSHEQEEVDERWRILREQLDQPPPAPETLGLVDQVAGDGIPPRRAEG